MHDRKVWGIGLEELEAAASVHITPDQYRLQPLDVMLEDMGCPVELEKTYVYVLWSNSEQFMAQVGSGCYILPSSLYELIVHPCEKKVDADLLHEMVQEVNQDAVSPEDFLSDSVYYCHADSGKVELCCV